jgi:hypothetical protein
MHFITVKSFESRVKKQSVYKIGFQNMISEIEHGGYW